jgi:hypothetical protein
MAIYRELLERTDKPIYMTEINIHDLTSTRARKAARILDWVSQQPYDRMLGVAVFAITDPGAWVPYDMDESMADIFASRDLVLGQAPSLPVARSHVTWTVPLNFAWDWSPDGEWVLYETLRVTADGTLEYDLFAATPDGRYIHQLTDSPGIDSDADWAP